MARSTTTLADVVARHRADRHARGLPPTITDPAVLRVVASIVADALAKTSTELPPLPAESPPKPR